MNQRSLFAAIGLMASFALSSCDGRPGQGQAGSLATTPSPKQPPMPNDTLRDFQLTSMTALAEARLGPEQIVSLGGHHRLRKLDRCILRFEHWAFKNSKGLLAGPKSYKREGYLLLLGQQSGKVIALATRCGVDMSWPHPGLVGESPGGMPKFIAGIVAFSLPDAAPSAPRDYYLVSRETDMSHPSMKNPNWDESGWVPGTFAKFVRETGINSLAFWKTLLESGDRIEFSEVGKNDFAFVTFEQKKVFGIVASDSRDGLKVNEVVPGTAASRAGLLAGDVLVSLNGRSVRNSKEFHAALDSCPVNEPLKVGYSRHRDLPVVESTFAFQHPGNFLSKGKVETLELSRPQEIIALVLAELDRVGALLSTEMYAICRWCKETIDRQEFVQPRDPAEMILYFAPMAAGLVGLDCGIRAGLYAADRIVHFLGDSISTIKTIHEEFGDVRAFYGKHVTLGEPFYLLPDQVRVGDDAQLQATDTSGKEHRLQLAYTAPKPGAAEYLRQLLVESKAAGYRLIAIPDGTDGKGNEHCHLVLLSAGNQPTVLQQLKGYLNLVLIRKGFATAVDHGVSDGKSTRVVLRGLRMVEGLAGR